MHDSGIAIVGKLLLGWHPLTRLDMAAIIAQITRAKRERLGKVTYQTNKCMYHLPPFDTHFNPRVHNKYLAR